MSQEYRPEHISGALEERLHAEVRADLLKIRSIKQQECHRQEANMASHWNEKVYSL